MSRMSDREAWISVFNMAFTAAMAVDRMCRVDGEQVTDYVFAKHVADKALQDAPKDEA